MKLQRLHDLQKQWLRANNIWLKACQRDGSDPAYLKALKDIADEAERKYNEAWRMYQGHAEQSK